jgi:hypothetical protein
MYFSSLHACYMSCPSNTPWLDHSNYIWWRVRVMKFFNIQISSTCRHFIPLQCKYFPQGILKYPQSTFFQVRAKVSRHTKLHSNFSSVYLKFCVFGRQASRHKVRNWMVASITRIQSPLNIPMNQILIVTVVLKCLYVFRHILKGSISYVYVITLLCILVTRCLNQKDYIP